MVFYFIYGNLYNLGLSQSCYQLRKWFLFIRFLYILNVKVSDVEARECYTTLLYTILYEPAMDTVETPNHHKPHNSNYPASHKASLIIVNEVENIPKIPPVMAIRVMGFSSGEYKIRKIFA